MYQMRAQYVKTISFSPNMSNLEQLYIIALKVDLVALVE